MVEKIFTAAVVATILAGNAFASSIPDICREIGKQKQPVAYLVDANDATVRGAAELGKIKLGNDVDDEHFKIRTGYRVVVRPRALDIREPVLGNGYSASLVPEEKSICPGTRTYRLILNWVRTKGELRPYAFVAQLPEFEFSDKFGHGEDVPNLYRFDARIVGEMISPPH